MGFMKQIIPILVAWLGFGSLAAAPMNKDDRQHVVAHLEMTESWLADEVSGLSPAQLNFRSTPGKWSILDVVEHLTLAEPMYWTGLRKALKEPPAKPKEPISDADLLWYGIDRTARQKTQASEEPTGKLTDVQVGLASFRKLRATILDYARTTDDDLRAHLFTDWGVDGFQGLLGISTHAQRHILQIREIKAQPGFPKK
jgi:DinB superfamily